MPRVIAAFALIATVPACTSEPPDIAQASAAVTLQQVTGFGSNPGNLLMFRYVPAGLPSGAPLVVALHGCTQSATAYATVSEWHVLADRHQLAVVFPQQQSGNNSSGCFNWFEPGDIARGQGEALSMKQMVDHMRSTVGSDPARVYIAGFSAGGSMAQVMMAAYPDVFAGGAVSSGGPYGCASDLTSAFSCMQGNANKTPAQWGALVRGAFPGYAGPYPPMVAFHGGADSLVNPANLQDSVDQWTNVHGIDGAADLTEAFRSATHKVYRDGAGRARIETYLMNGVGHALGVDPGTGADQGGATGAFAEDHDIWSSYYAAQFWGLLGDDPGDGGDDTDGGDADDGGDDGDTSPPTAAITAPASGATVSGALAVRVTASDDVGVTRVEVRVDGAAVGSDSTAPHVVDLDTRTLSDGAHTLSAVAFDAAGNTGASPGVPITVANGGGGGALSETFSSASGPDNAGWALGPWALDARDATGVAGSRSVTATAAAQFNTVTRTASWSGIALGAAPRLSYRRQLSLSAANVLASARFRVVVDDGAEHVVDSQVVTGPGNHAETTFTARSDIDLAAFAGKTVTLKLVVSATDPASIVTRAQAWIDQIEIR